MATKFSEIYEKAVWKVRDYDSLVRTPETSEAMYFNLLLSAIADVQHYTPIPLTYKKDGDEYIFDEELSAELQELLALGVAVKWLEPHFLNSDALKKGMFNKDYKDFGLDADKIAGIYHALRKLFEGKAKTMSFRYSNFDRLTPRRG